MIFFSIFEFEFSGCFTEFINKQPKGGSVRILQGVASLTSNNECPNHFSVRDTTSFVQKISENSNYKIV